MCPQGSDKGREPEFKKALSWSNFLKIVDEAEKHGVESISLHGGGEPTLNKYFIPAIKYIFFTYCIRMIIGIPIQQKSGIRMSFFKLSG